MNKEFIPYEQALALKALGFDEPCLAFYNGKFIQSTEFDFDSYNSKDIGDCPLAPTFSQAFRWFRENYDITQTIARDGSLAKEGRWAYTIIADVIYFNDGYNTYEEAELACLIKLIQIVKDGNK